MGEFPNIQSPNSRILTQDKPDPFDMFLHATISSACLFWGMKSEANVVVGDGNEGKEKEGQRVRKCSPRRKRKTPLSSLAALQ